MQMVKDEQRQPILAHHKRYDLCIRSSYIHNRSCDLHSLWISICYILRGGVLTALTVLLTLPTIMLVARRLRDSNNDPTLMILIFVPILGWLILLYLLCKRSAPTQEVNVTNEQISAEPSIKEKKSILGVFIVAILVLGLGY